MGGFMSGRSAWSVTVQPGCSSSGVESFSARRPELGQRARDGLSFAWPRGGLVLRIPLPHVLAGFIPQRARRRPNGHSPPHLVPQPGDPLDAGERFVQRDLPRLIAPEQTALVSAAHGGARLVNRAPPGTVAWARKPKSVVNLAASEREVQLFGERELLLLQRSDVEEEPGAAKPARHAEIRAARLRHRERILRPQMDFRHVRDEPRGLLYALEGTADADPRSVEGDRRRGSPTR
jgi:hypothetical protein